VKLTLTVPCFTAAIADCGNASFVDRNKPEADT